MNKGYVLLQLDTGIQGVLGGLGIQRILDHLHFTFYRVVI